MATIGNNLTVYGTLTFPENSTATNIESQAGVIYNTVGSNPNIEYVFKNNDQLIYAMGSTFVDMSSVSSSYLTIKSPSSVETSNATFVISIGSDSGVYTVDCIKFDAGNTITASTNDGGTFLWAYDDATAIQTNYVATTFDAPCIFNNNIDTDGDLTFTAATPLINSASGLTFNTPSSEPSMSYKFNIAGVSTAYEIGAGYTDAVTLSSAAYNIKTATDVVGSYLSHEGGFANTYYGWSLYSEVTADGPSFIFYIASGGELVNYNPTTGINTSDVPTIFSSGATVSSPTLGLGYSAGAGGTVTQATSKTTGVTLNKSCGEITMNNSSLAGSTAATFTLTNSAIGANDVVIVNIVSGSTGVYTVDVVARSAGSCSIQVFNLGSTLSDTLVLSFAVIKAAIT